MSYDLLRLSLCYLDLSCRTHRAPYFKPMAHTGVAWQRISFHNTHTHTYNDTTHTYTATSVIASMPRFDSWVVTCVVGITLFQTLVRTTSHHIHPFIINNWGARSAALCKASAPVETGRGGDLRMSLVLACRRCLHNKGAANSDA